MIYRASAPIGKTGMIVVFEVIGQHAFCKARDLAESRRQVPKLLLPLMPEIAVVGMLHPNSPSA